MNILERLKQLDALSKPAPWQWADQGRKEESDISYVEPFTDGSKGRGFEYDVIVRDSGVYPPDIDTCELIMEMRNSLSKLLPVIEAAIQVADHPCLTATDIELTDLRESLAKLRGEA